MMNDPYDDKANGFENNIEKEDQQINDFLGLDAQSNKEKQKSN